MASRLPECHRTRTRRSGSPIRHSREGGNPRTNVPRKNVNRETATYVHTATPLRLSGESTPRTPIRRRNPEGCGRCQFSYLGVPAPAGIIAMKACPGPRSDDGSLETARVPPDSSFRLPNSIPRRRDPRTVPRKNVNRETTTYVNTATPLRLSGESTPRTPIRRRNPEGCGRCQFSYLGVPAPAGISNWNESIPIRDDVTRPRLHGSPTRFFGPHSSFRRRPESRRGGVRPPHKCETPRLITIFIPLCGLPARCVYRRATDPTHSVNPDRIGIRTAWGLGRAWPVQ